MNIIQISAGRDRSLMLSTDGTAYALGAVELLGPTLPPDYPQELCLSNPTEIGHRRFAQPTPLAINPGRRFRSVADGFVDTVAVRDDGAILSCRPVVSREHGSRVVALKGLPRGARQVTLSESAGFALYADGSVWSWGMNLGGQLGRPVAALAAVPAAIEGLPPIEALAAGHAHVLALDRAGGVWAWGANAAGQLGVGDLGQRAAPVRVELPHRMRRVAAGDTHSLALDDAGCLWAWGANQFGQVGEVMGMPVEQRFFTRPQRVRSGFKAARLDAGMFYSAAISTDGDVFAWGWNGLGQLAAHGLTASARPRRIAGLKQVEQLAAGLGHVLALSGQGVFAWGDNRASACGAAPSTPIQAEPRQITIA